MSGMVARASQAAVVERQPIGIGFDAWGSIARTHLLGLTAGGDDCGRAGCAGGAGAGVREGPVGKLSIGADRLAGRSVRLAVGGNEGQCKTMKANVGQWKPLYPGNVFVGESNESRMSSNGNGE
ncbi:MAG: hypothetical protein ACOY94_25435 [Bacillota bacterium]